jgi:hypothetical protein
VVSAALVGQAAPATPLAPGQTNPGQLPGDGDSGDQAASARSLDSAGLSGEGASAWPAVLLAVACGFVWVAAWVLGMLWQRWPAYGVCLPLFLVMLFYFFESFSRLLPANY